MIDKNVRCLALATAVTVVIAFTGLAPAYARGGFSTGAAVGIGLGSFALGSAVGAAANPYYNPGYYPYGRASSLRPDFLQSYERARDFQGALSGRVVARLQRARFGGTVDRPRAEAMKALARVHYRASTRAVRKRLRAES